MGRRKRNRAVPVPEAIPLRGRTSMQPWTVRHNPHVAEVDLHKREMVADLRAETCDRCGGDHPRASRLHEMGHVTWTPLDWAEQAEAYSKATHDLEFVDAVEDGRLNFRHGEAGTTMPPLVCPTDIEMMVLGAAAQQPKPDYRKITATGVAALGGADEGPFWQAVDTAIERGLLRPEATDILSEHLAWARSQFGGTDKPTYGYHTLNVAKYLAEAPERMEEAAAEAAEAEAEAKAAEEAAEQLADEMHRDSDPRGLNRDGDEWGRLEVDRPPLVRRVDYWMRRNVVRNEGVVPTRPDRAKLDGRIFGRQVKRGTAAILVDASGSMHWSEEDLRELLDRFPATTVAVYSGGNPDEYDCTMGRLRVVAENGRRAATEHVGRPAAGYNVVDGPALRWLSQQKVDKRIWVSDAKVTGRDESVSPTLVADAMEICQRGKIQVVRDKDEALEAIASKRTVKVGAASMLEMLEREATYAPEHWLIPAREWAKGRLHANAAATATRNARLREKHGARRGRKVGR